MTCELYLKKDFVLNNECGIDEILSGWGDKFILAGEIQGLFSSPKFPK